MKKLIYTVVCMMLFCCACSDSDIELNPATQAKQQLAMTFRCGAMSPTRAATDDTRIDDINLYLFPANGDPARHLYIAPVRPVVLELPKGDYTLYAIANLGHDAGERTQDFVRTLHVERDPAVLADAPFPMSAQQSVTVRGDTQIAVSLIRAVAKVNFSYTVAADFAKSFRVKFIQLRSVPRSATLFGSSRAESSEAVADMPPIETSATTYAATYYLLENRQGEVAGIGYQQQKDQTRAPEHATYIAIAGEADGTQVVYRIYLGANNTTDFNVGRNRVYNIDARMYWAVFSSLMDMRGSGIDNFAVFLMCGQLLFNFFNEATSTGMSSVLGAAPLLKKVYIPKYIFPLEKCCFAMVNCVFSFVALLLVMIFTGAPFHLTLIEAVYPLVTLFFFSLGVGLLLAAATVFFRDIMHIWSVFITALLYFSAIFYDPTQMTFSIGGFNMQQIIKLNPMYWYITGFRRTVMWGIPLDFNMFAVCGCCAVLSMLVGVWVFRKTQDRFVLHI